MKLESNTPSLNTAGPEHAKRKERIKKVQESIRGQKIAPTALSTVKLHMYNFFARNPGASESQIETELGKLETLTRKENSCGDPRNPLPTVGIEIELPIEWLNKEKVYVLNALGISNYEETFTGIWEVNAQYSYSATTQARLIQELVNLGAVPTKTDSDKISATEPLSLHLNFGIPTDFENIPPNNSFFDTYNSQVRSLNDLLVYAFTSVDRLRQRKSRTSVKERETKVVSIHNQSKLSWRRLELLAVEFKDSSSFRMILDAQKLMSMLVAYAKYDYKMTHSETEELLAKLWISFEAEVSGYLQAKKLEPNAVDIDPVLVEEMLENSDLRTHCRSIISNYSTSVDAILKKAGVSA